MLNRLLALWRRPPAPSEEPSAVPDAAGAATHPPPAAAGHATNGQPPVAASAPISTVAAWHLLARRPLIDARGSIAGWDLRLSDWAVQRLARSGAQRILKETYGFALVHAARDACRGGRRALVTLSGLDDTAALVDALPAGTIVVVGDGSGNEWERVVDHLDALHRGGVYLAVPADVLGKLPADYALLDGARLGSTEVLRQSKRQSPAPAGWIATNLNSYDEVTEAVRSRVQFACGRFVLARERPGRTAAPQAAVSAAGILTALVDGRAPRELAEMFKTDVTLSYRLLRYLSVAGVGGGRPAQSIQDAVIMLGAREMHRWLCVLLADAGSSPIAHALHETALTRGRLLELLAIARKEPRPEALFVLGAFSLLDLLLDVPLEVALALTPLPEPAVDALIAEEGPWRPYLNVALALEAGDGARLDAACAALGLTRDEVVGSNEKAAEWSTQAALAMRQPA